MVEKRDQIGELVKDLVSDREWSIGDQFLRLRIQMHQRGVSVADCPWDVPIGKPVLVCDDGHWRVGKWGEVAWPG